MNKQHFAFGKWNYILLAVGVVAIILGFLLMMGPSSTETHFEPDIFSFRRIKLAPAICFLGFVFVGFAIMYKGKQKESNGTQLKRMISLLNIYKGKQKENNNTKQNINNK